MLKLRVLLTVLALMLMSIAVRAINDEIPPAIIENDEGGVAIIQGEVSYTNPLFTTTASDSFIMLEDQTGFIKRDYNYTFPLQSQTFAQITSDIYQSPFDYTLQLPLEPQAPLNDLDHDNETDVGVQVFQVAFWTNTYGDMYVEPRDGRGWSGSYSSARVENQPPDRIYEYTGGNLVIYAPVDGQAFPSGFGDDGKLFTDDDPLVIVPQGWTVVNMDTDVFTFDRSKTAKINLIEGEASASQDFSNMSYPDAFDALVDYYRDRYAFTDLKGIDWDALHDKYRPRFEEAANKKDINLYALAMRDFEWEFNDAHVSMGQWFNYLQDQFFAETDGGLGIAIRETSDGRVIVDYLLPNSPADTAGIKLGAEILEINGVPIQDAIDKVVPWSSPFSGEHVKRLQQLRYVVRFAVGDTVELTYRNPDASSEDTASMQTVNERDSFSHSSFLAGVNRVPLPVQWELINNYYYVHLRSFSEDSRLTIQLWERMIDEANQNGISGIIIDMRNNNGGSSALSDYMPGYFFDNDTILGYSETYEDSIGGFYRDTNYPSEMLVPPPGKRYHGTVVLLIDPTCISACELFSQHMTLNHRATLIGQYPTAGAAGGWTDVTVMPEGFTVVMPTVRNLDTDGNILIEGKGVPPDIVVPVNEDTLGLTGVQYLNNDPLLDSAVKFLDSGAGIETVDAGEIGYDEQVQGTLKPKQRARYTFTIKAGADPVGIYVVSDMDTYLRLYDETGTTVLLQNDNFAGTKNSGFDGISLNRDLTIIIEVASANDTGSGDYTLMVTSGGHPFKVNTVDKGSIAIGDTVSDDIVEGQRDSYSLALDANQAVNISLDSPDKIDTYLRVYDADGNLLAENDDVDKTTKNSLLEAFSVDKAMTVTVVAGTVDDNEAGKYELSIQASN